MRIDVEVKVPCTQTLKGHFYFAIVNKNNVTIALVGLEGDAKIMARAIQDNCDWDHGLKIRRIVDVSPSNGSVAFQRIPR